MRYELPMRYAPSESKDVITAVAGLIALLGGAIGAGAIIGWINDAFAAKRDLEDYVSERSAELDRLFDERDRLIEAQVALRQKIREAEAQAGGVS